MEETRRRYPGFYRRFYQAPIETVYYDIETRMFKDMHIEIPYEYSSYKNLDIRIINKSTLSKMYKTILRDKDIIGCILINSDKIAKIYRDSIRVVDMLDYLLLEYSHVRDYSNYAKEEIMPVGFERTTAYSVEILVTPGRIYKDKNTGKIYFNGEWKTIENDVDLIEYKSKDVYKELMKTNKKGVLVTKSKNLFI